MAASYDALSVEFAAIGDEPAAEEQLKKGIALLETLNAEFPNNPDYQAQLAGRYSSWGEMLRKRGQWIEAERQTRKSVSLMEGLPANFLAQPFRRINLATSHLHLGKLLAERKRWDEAEDSLRKAVRIFDRLSSDFPSTPAYRNDLSDCQTQLGLLLRDVGRRPEAEQQLRNAMATREKLVADHPEHVMDRIDLGGSYCNFGSWVRDGQPADSLEWFEKAIRTLAPVHEREPRNATAKQYLRNSHWNRAVAFDRLGRHDDAVKDWTKAVELSPPEDQSGMRTALGTSLLRSGRAEEAALQVRHLIQFWEGRVRASAGGEADAKGLAQATLDIGNMYLHANAYAEAAEAIVWLERAVKLYGDYYATHHRGIPDTQKEQLKWAHWSLAVALNALDRPADAVAEMDRVLRHTPEEQARNPRMCRTRYTAKTDAHKAVTDRVAEQLKAPPTGYDLRWFMWDAGLAYSLAVKAAGGDEAVQTRYAEKAVALLRLSVQAGFDDLALAKRDKDLDPLRDRADFQKLVADLEAKFPPRREVLPPPRKE